MSSAESTSKRIGFRRDLRNKQIQEIFRVNRLRFFQGGDDSIQNRNAINIISKGSQRSSMISDEITQLLQCQVNNNFNGVFLSNETILKILKIALEFRDQPCINEQAMIILILNAQEDFKMVVSSKEELSRQEKKMKCQRVGQILWILSNECSRCSQISLDVTERLVKLCVGLIKFEYEAKGQMMHGIEMRESNKNDFEGLDQYVMGLCIMLLGNICISQEHVSCIINEIKLSQFLEILNGLIDVNNYQDLSFTVSNILYYYPDLAIQLRNFESDMQQEGQQNIHHIAKQQRMVTRLGQCLLRCNRQQVELCRILLSLFNRLKDDLLFFTYNMLCRSEQPMQTPVKAEGENRKQRSKFKIEIASQGKNLSQSKSKYHILQLSQVQIKKIKQNLGDKFYGSELNYNSSQNYSKDLMECIDKIKSLMNSIFERENQIEQRIQEIDENRVSNLRLDRQPLKKTTSELMHLIKQIQFDVVTKVIKMIIVFGRERQVGEQVYGFGANRNRVSNMVTFIRDIYRHFQYSDRYQKDYQDKQSNRKQLSRLQYDFNKQVHEKVFKRYGREVFEFIHGIFCGYETNLNEEDLQRKNSKENLPNQELQLDINNACWEIYEYQISYLNKNGCWGSGNSNVNRDLREGRLLQRKIKVRDSSDERSQSNQFLEMLNSEMDWLEMTLMVQKSQKQLGNSRAFTRLNISQECRVIEIMSKYNPIFTVLNSYEGIREKNGYSDLKSFEYRKGIGENEVLEINLYKIHDFLSTLDYKLIEHQNDHPTIISILQGIQNIVQRVKSIYGSDHYEKCQMIPIQNLLGSKLYNILENDLSDKYVYVEDGYGVEIYELIRQILQKNIEVMQQDQN